MPLPQQAPQSCGQFAQVSVPSQAPLGQVVGQAPQSAVQLVQLSPRAG